jgi:hypothetical protein
VAFEGFDVASFAADDAAHHVLAGDWTRCGGRVLLGKAQGAACSRRGLRRASSSTSPSERRNSSHCSADLVLALDAPAPIRSSSLGLRTAGDLLEALAVLGSQLIELGGALVDLARAPVHLLPAGVELLAGLDAGAAPRQRAPFPAHHCSSRRASMFSTPRGVSRCRQRLQLVAPGGGLGPSRVTWIRRRAVPSLERNSRRNTIQLSSNARTRTQENTATIRVSNTSIAIGPQVTTCRLCYPIRKVYAPGDALVKARGCPVLRTV